MNFRTNSAILFLSRFTLSGSKDYKHESFDFIYVLSGDIQLDTLRISGIYTSGDIFLMNPGQAYTLSSIHPNAILHIGIASSYFYSHLSGYPFLICDSVSEPGNDYTKIKRLLSSIAAKYAEDARLNTLSIHGLLLLLLEELNANSQNLIPEDQLAQIPSRYHDRVIQIMDYINLHYHQEISLPDLSSTLFLSPQHISAFLKTYMHTSFKKLLNEKRLFHAERDLRFTDLSVTEIAIRNGFSNTNTFYKNFMAAYRLSPKEYRKKICSTLLVTDGCANFSTDARAFTEDALLSQPQSVTVNMSGTGQFHKNICTLINIGRAQNLLSRKYQKNLLSVCWHFGFRYIRIQEVISNAFIPRCLPDYDYFFQNVNTAVSFLCQNDLIPIIELSKRYQQHYSLSSFPNAILRSDRFFRLFEGFLSYCQARWPADWLSKWQFELWFSPKDTPEKYAADVRRIRKLVDQYLPGAKVGGPGYNPCLPLYPLPDFLTALHKEMVCLDFISISLNYCTYENDILQISTDKNLLKKRCQTIKEELHIHAPKIPLYVTEWTSAYIPELPVSQSRYQAAFICRSILELQDSCDLLGYWIFMDDILAKTADVIEFDYWNQGLLNTDFQKSPAFYAFEIMSERGSQIICKGPNYLITQKSTNHYQVIAFNYAHFDAAHTGMTEQQDTFHHIYDIFETVPEIHINLRLAGLAAGSYQVTRRLLNKYHGSYLDILIGEYTHSNIEQNEFLQYAKAPFGLQNRYRLRSCTPEERTIYVSVEHTLTLPSVLPAHCVCAWDIRRLSPVY